MKNNIVGLKYIINPEYQKEINTKMKDIMQSENEISVENLKTNSIFNSLCDIKNEEAKDSLFDKIKKIAGNIIDKNEMKVILYLLDANLETIKDKETEAEKEAFVMDGKFDINENSGIFQITPKEVASLMKIATNYDVDNLEYFPELQKDGSVTLYDKNNNPIHNIKKEDLQNGTNE